LFCGQCWPNVWEVLSNILFDRMMLVEKVSASLFTPELVSLLLDSLKSSVSGVQLAALVALEKFSQTPENKRKLDAITLTKLLSDLESDLKTVDNYKIQSRFYASWLLDHRCKLSKLFC
jgi:hypothetical protein